ncbi:hypothetical protein [Nocardiopsis sp. CC223A]|uniref:hypothetical protein n=1 Tax=Nocardiopsis sp. CC223A TaxID=3044051 RepID=UPI00278C3514|nr:hypothetical protein [Nocardiopsis sp. CC223A]
MRKRAPAGGRTEFQRHYRYRSLAVAAVELSLAGKLEEVKVARYDRWGLIDPVTEHLAEITDPDAAAGRVGALADALLEQLPDRVDAADVALVVRERERRLAPLLRQPSTDDSDTDEDPLMMSPAEYLTARYAAPGQAALN